MFRYCYLLLALCIISTVSNAQGFVLKGIVKDSVTEFAISGAKVTNTNSNKSIFTDQNGFFHLVVAPNDLVRLDAANYTSGFLTYSVLFNDTISVFLSPSGKILPTVSVTSRYTKYQIDSMSRKREFEENRGNRLSTVSSAPGFGIAINLDKIFKNKYKYQRKNEKRFSAVEKASYVAYRFSPQLVASYTGLKGNALQRFLNQFTPSYEWLRAHPTNEEVMYYLNEKMKLFKTDIK